MTASREIQELRKRNNNLREACRIRGEALERAESENDALHDQLHWYRKLADAARIVTEPHGKCWSSGSSCSCGKDDLCNALAEVDRAKERIGDGT